MVQQDGGIEMDYNLLNCLIGVYKSKVGKDTHEYKIAAFKGTNRAFGKYLKSRRGLDVD
jgi:hypothetical protein